MPHVEHRVLDMGAQGNAVKLMGRRPDKRSASTTQSPDIHRHTCALLIWPTQYLNLTALEHRVERLSFLAVYQDGAG
jgi:hypothetical protein